MTILNRREHAMTSPFKSGQHSDRLDPGQPWGVGLSLSRSAVTLAAVLTLGFSTVGTIVHADSFQPTDIFRFRDGRIIAGKIKPGSEKQVEVAGIAVKAWAVEIAPGDFLMVYESDLKRNGHERPTKTEIEYYQKMQNEPPQTAEEHVAVAGWCAQQGLKDLRIAHYERAVELDPKNRTARDGAGYKEDSNGRWQKKEVVMGEQRGKIRIGNRWRFPEDVKIEEAKAKADAELAPIRKQMNSWHTAVAFGRSERAKTAAITELQNINDPRQANILTVYLLDQRRKAPVEVRLMYVRILAKFPNAVAGLTNASLTDTDSQVRVACLDALERADARFSVPTYVSYLQNSDNQLINRAANGIARFAPQSAVEPLIYALVTEHEVVKGGGNNQFGGGGLALGAKAKKVKEKFENKQVYAALTQISGQDFGYNQNRWLAWYASIHAAPAGDLRRDL